MSVIMQAIDKIQPNHDIATQRARATPSSARCSPRATCCAPATARAGQRTGFLARMLGLAGTGLMLYTNWLGGRLVDELGEGVKPMMEQMENQEKPQPMGRELTDGALSGAGRTAALSQLG